MSKGEFFKYEDARKKLASSPDKLLLKGGIKDRESCLALWDWCVPKIKSILQSMKSCREFESVLIPGARKGTSSIVNDSAIELLYVSNWEIVMSYRDSQTHSPSIFFNGNTVYFSDGWEDSIPQALNGLIRFNQYYNDIMRSVKDLIAQNGLYNFSASGNNAREYFQREFKAKGNPFEKVISEMQGMRISDAEILDTLKESLSGVVWED